MLAGRLLRGFGLFVAVTAAVTVVANAFVIATTTSRRFDEVGDIAAKHVAIVLGASVSGSSPSTVLEDRLRAAEALYKTGKVRKILVSGDHGTTYYDEPNVMRTWLVARGVPSSDVFMDHAGFRTLDTMERAARVFGVEDAVICTQSFHLARAVFLARRAGIDAVGMAADRRRYAGAWHNQGREFVARTVAVVDAYVIRREPAVSGEEIPIGGSAQATHDAHTTHAPTPPGP